jgi:hypothetical protein
VPLFESDRSDTDNRRNLAVTLFNIGDALRALGRLSQAKQPAEEACTLLTAIGARAPYDDFVLASAHDLSADLIGKSRESLPATERARRDDHVAQAIAALRQAIAGGYRALDPKSFSSIQSQRDFQELMLDRAFPDWPFSGFPTPRQ